MRIGVFWTRYNPVKTGVWSRRRKSTVCQKMSVFWCASVGSYTNQKPTIIKEFGVVVQRGIVRYMTDWTVIFPVGKGKNRACRLKCWQPSSNLHNPTGWRNWNNFRQFGTWNQGFLAWKLWHGIAMPFFPPGTPELCHSLIQSKAIF